MEKIKDLITSACKAADIPDKITLKGGGIMLKFLIRGRLLIPIVVMMTNINHYKASGKQLIYIKGGIIPDPELPFKCRIDDDIDLELTQYPIGYIFIQIATTIRQLRPYIVDGKLDEIALKFGDYITQVSGDKKYLTIKDYLNLTE